MKINIIFLTYLLFFISLQSCQNKSDRIIKSAKDLAQTLLPEQFSKSSLDRLDRS